VWLALWRVRFLRSNLLSVEASLKYPGGKEEVKRHLKQTVEEELKVGCSWDLAFFVCVSSVDLEGPPSCSGLLYPYSSSAFCQWPRDSNDTLSKIKRLQVYVAALG